VLGERWGVSDAEVARRYPCDDLVPSPAVQLWRGVTVAAPVEQVWPWLRQLRLAPYSYDWIDNLGRRSPRDLRELPDPQVGDPFTRAGGFDAGRVLATTPGEHLTAQIMGAVLSYVLVPQGAQSRLLLKVVVERARWWVPALAVGDWPMARRQLLNLAALAERVALRPDVEDALRRGPARRRGGAVTGTAPSSRPRASSAGRGPGR
jgi:hypothetical protein